jgi:hypothetical protein
MFVIGGQGRRSLPVPGCCKSCRRRRRCKPMLDSREPCWCDLSLPATSNSLDGSMNQRFVLGLAGEDEQNAWSLKRLYQSCAGSLAQVIDHPRNEGRAFLPTIVLIDQERRPALPNLFDLGPVGVLGRVLPAEGLRGHLKTVVGIEEHEFGLRRRLHQPPGPSPSEFRVVRDDLREVLRIAK